MTVFTLEQLEIKVIDFGTKWKGAQYQKVWSDDQQYCHWFLVKYGKSSNLRHRLFVHYLEMKIDECEQTGTRLEVSSPLIDTHSAKGIGQMLEQVKATQAISTKAKTRAKAKSKTPAPTRAPIAEEEPEWDDVQTEMDQFEMQNDEVQELQMRMTNIEGALQQVINHLQTMSEREHP